MFVTIYYRGNSLYRVKQRALLTFRHRLAAQRGAACGQAGGMAIRAVALGCRGSGGAFRAGRIGVWIAGVPDAGILTAVMLDVVALRKIGPSLPLLGGWRVAFNA